MPVNSPYSTTVSHSPFHANSATLAAFTATQTGQFSTYLRPSSHWPTRLPAVGKASNQGTSESV